MTNRGTSRRPLARSWILILQCFFLTTCRKNGPSFQLLEVEYRARTPNIPGGMTLIERRTIRASGEGTLESYFADRRKSYAGSFRAMLTSDEVWWIDHLLSNAMRFGIVDPRDAGSETTATLHIVHRDYERTFRLDDRIRSEPSMAELLRRIDTPGPRTAVYRPLWSVEIHAFSYRADEASASISMSLRNPHASSFSILNPASTRSSIGSAGPLYLRAGGRVHRLGTGPEAVITVEATDLPRDTEVVRLEASSQRFLRLLVRLPESEREQIDVGYSNASPRAANQDVVTFEFLATLAGTQRAIDRAARHPH